MNLDCVERIAEAVLYEGYMLYPYRASAVKNQQRWNFGVLCPRSYSEQQNGSDAWMMQTECLLQSEASTQLVIEVRFLQIVNRSIGKPAYTPLELPRSGEPELELVDKLVVDGRPFAPWQEALERKVAVPTFRPVTDSCHRSLVFEFRSDRKMEPIRNREGSIAGVIVREWEVLTGSVEIDVKECQKGLSKVTVRLRNLTEHESSGRESRGDALMHSLVSAHTILGTENGQFVSMLDPPQQFKDLATGCRNLGTWPVLVGERDARDAMLSSPIILYDYPQIAPESPGSLFDGTEIDEILSLRILTMTDEEKKEMRQSDERARQILERTESMSAEQFMKLHGVLRELRPISGEVS